jgi:nitric oxide reductase NorE protein
MSSSQSSISQDIVCKRSASIWPFVMADCFSFGAFFFVFMTERIAHRSQFIASSRLLDIQLGLLNTCILLTSSWLLALATSAAKRGDVLRFRHNMLAAILVGSCFGVVKLFEYGQKFHDGINPLTNTFFSYYFILTGLHLLHYSVGIIVLITLLVQAARLAKGEGKYLSRVENGAIYWHLVDLLWIFLFPILYLQGSQ